MATLMFHADCGIKAIDALSWKMCNFHMDMSSCYEILHPHIHIWFALGIHLALGLVKYPCMDMTYIFYGHLFLQYDTSVSTYLQALPLCTTQRWWLISWSLMSSLSMPHRISYIRHSCKLCQMLPWWTKNSLHSIIICDTVTTVLPLYSVYQAPSYEPNLTSLAAFPSEWAYLSMLFILEMFCTACRPQE